VVLARKPIGEVGCFTDFRGIKNVYPKDNFPLPNIDMIIYSMTILEIISFMDVLFGFNQIRINKQD